MFVSLPQEVLQWLDSNIRQRMNTYNLVDPNKKNIKKIWLCEDELEFLHGLIVGEILGDAYRTAAMLLERVPTDEENQEIHSMVEAKRFEIKKIIVRVKNV